MKTIVIYESQTGFTEQYARWLADALGCDCRALKGTTAAALSGYERVIFGGWVMGNGISGLAKLQGMTAPAAVFAVGATPAYEEVVAAIREQNKLDDTPFYYLVGGFRFEKLPFFQRIMLKGLKKATAKQTGRTRQGDSMAEMLGTSFDHATRDQLAPMVAWLREDSETGPHTEQNTRI